MRYVRQPSARLGILLAASSLLLSACNTARAGEIVTTDALACASIDPQTGIWESAPFGPVDAETCGWIRLPEETAVRVRHGLDYRPRAVHVYISFEPDGSGAAPSAGDMSRILEVTGPSTAGDPGYVLVENDTRATLYARLALQ